MSTARASGESLIRVTRADPCRRCEKGTNRCSRSKDCRVEICCNVGGPGAEERTDKAGETYYVYGSGSGVERVDAGAMAGATRPERAVADELDAVYSAMLNLLDLSDGHEKAMIARGFAPGEARGLGYRTLPSRGR